MHFTMLGRVFSCFRNKHGDFLCIFLYLDQKKNRIQKFLHAVVAVVEFGYVSFYFYSADMSGLENGQWFS